MIKSHKQAYDDEKGFDWSHHLLKKGKEKKEKINKLM